MANYGTVTMFVGAVPLTDGEPVGHFTFSGLDFSGEGMYISSYTSPDMNIQLYWGG